MIKQAKSDPGLDQSNPGCKNVLTMALTRGFKMVGNGYPII